MLKIYSLSKFHVHSEVSGTVVARLQVRSSEQRCELTRNFDLSSYQILIRLSKLCVQESASVRKSRKQQQRLLRNMGAHAVVLELLQIPYEKVGIAPSLQPDPTAAAPRGQVPGFSQNLHTWERLVKK